jgi:GTPase
MVAAAWGGAADADIVVLLIEAHRGLTEGRARRSSTAARPMPQGQPVALAINKIDRVKAEVLLALAEEMNDGLSLRAHLHDLGRTGYGVDDLRAGWRARCPRGRGSTPRTRSPTCRCA